MFPVDGFKINHLTALYPDSDAGSLRIHIGQRDVLPIGL